MEIVIKIDLGNNPQKEVIKNFNVAFGKGDIAFLLASVSENIVWNMVGNEKITGKKGFEVVVKNMAEEEAKKLTLEQMVVEGSVGTAYGTIEDKEGNIWSFSDFYEFESMENHKIKSLTSHLIKVK